GRRSAAISVWVRSPGLNLGLVQDGPRPWLRSTSASWGARRSRSADRTSIDRGFDACCALVHIHPPALDVTTHHVDFAVGWIAISRAQIVECGNSPVTVLIFALSRGENLFAGSILEVIDVRLIDIELQKQLAGLRSCFHHHRNPLPLRPPIIEPRRSQLVDPFRQIVSVVFGQALAFVSCRQAGIKERTGDTAAYFSRNAVEDIEQPRAARAVAHRPSESANRSQRKDRQISRSRVHRGRSIASNREIDGRAARTGKTVARCACAIPRSGNTGIYGRMARGAAKTSGLYPRSLSAFSASREP